VAFRPPLHSTPGSKQKLRALALVNADTRPDLKTPSKSLPFFKKAAHFSRSKTQAKPPALVFSRHRASTSPRSEKGGFILVVGRWDPPLIQELGTRKVKIPLIISPTHKRTEGRAPVWSSKFTSKDAKLQGGSSGLGTSKNGR